MLDFITKTPELFIVSVAYIAIIIWIIHKKIPGKWKSTASLAITIFTIVFQSPLARLIHEL